MCGEGMTGGGGPLAACCVRLVVSAPPPLPPSQLLSRCTRQAGGLGADQLGDVPLMPLISSQGRASLLLNAQTEKVSP